MKETICDSRRVNCSMVDAFRILSGPPSGIPIQKGLIPRSIRQAR
jgi:hypothetical protein